MDGSFGKPLNVQGESKNLIKSILDGIGDPTMIIDPGNYRILMVNQAMINLTHEPNYLSKCCYELTHARDSPCEQPEKPCPLRQVMETRNTVRVLHIHTTAEIEKIYVDIVATPVFEKEKVVQVVESFHDITKIKLVEETLRKTRDYLDRLINYANAPIIVWDSEIKLTRINSAFEHLVGYSSSEIIGQDLSIIFPEESRMRSLRKMTQFSGEYLESVEIPIFRKDGDIRFTIWSMANVYEEDGTTIISTIAQGTDITERKWAEQNLQRTAEELQYSNELKDLFIDILHHDLLNPAGIVKGYTDVLLAKDAYKGDIQTLEIIKKNNDKIIETVETASKFAKLKTIEDLNFIKLDIGPVVQEVIEYFRPVSEEKQVTIQFNKKGPYYAWANPIIEDLFSNLLSNAIKYSPKRGRIILDILDEGRYWKFVIIDVGPGIHDNNKTNIFERFKHIDKYGIKGTGLGLAIVKRIAELHNGNVGVEDNPEGKGSLFWATIKKA